MIHSNCINTHNTVERGDVVIKLDYKNDKPLHEQITHGIKELIISGVLKKDDQLPSVRDLSVELTVNPNTVQRAYKTLEADGIIYSIRGKGNFVSEIPDADKKTIEGLYLLLKETVNELAFFGEAQENIEEIVRIICKERNETNDQS